MRDGIPKEGNQLNIVIGQNGNIADPSGKMQRIRVVSQSRYQLLLDCETQRIRFGIVSRLMEALPANAGIAGTSAAQDSFLAEIEIEKNVVLRSHSQADRIRIGPGIGLPGKSGCCPGR